MTDLGQSHYEHATPPPLAAPSLVGQVRADVAILGGGLMGVAAALHLASLGRDVVLVEAACLGAGASGRNGGQFLPGYSASHASCEALIGPAAALDAYRLTLEAVVEVRRLIADHAIACDYTPGAVYVASKPGHGDDLRREADIRAKAGHDGLTWHDHATMTDRLGTARHHGGLFDPWGGHGDPLKLARGLAAAATRQGARIYESSPVIAIERDAALRTAHGRVVANHVILAGGVGLGALVPELAGAVLPATTFMVATAPMDADLQARVLPHNDCVINSRFIVDYFRKSTDGRLLWGGEVSYAARTDQAYTDVLTRSLRATFPDLAKVPIEQAWAGVIDLARLRLPLVGHVAPKISYGLGLSGHGVILAVLMGRLLAEASLRDSAGFDQLAALPRQNFPGGPALRQPLLVLGMLYARLRDWLA